MPWLIRVYIPVEIEENQEYGSREEAENEAEGLRLMQPENIFMVEEVEPQH